MQEADNSRKNQDQNSASMSREERSRRADVGEAAEQDLSNRDRAGQNDGQGRKQGSERPESKPTTR